MPSATTKKLNQMHFEPFNIPGGRFVYIARGPEGVGLTKALSVSAARRQDLVLVHEEIIIPALAFNSDLRAASTGLVGYVTGKGKFDEGSVGLCTWDEKGRIVQGSWEMGLDRLARVWQAKGKAPHYVSVLPTRVANEYGLQYHIGAGTLPNGASVVWAMEESQRDRSTPEPRTKVNSSSDGQRIVIKGVKPAELNARLEACIGEVKWARRQPDIGRENLSDTLALLKALKISTK